MLMALAACAALGLLANCAPGEAGAISLHRKFKSRPGVASSQHLVRCNDLNCEGSETSSNCPIDCFADAVSANIDGSNEYFSCAAWSSGTWQKLIISLWYRPTAVPTTSDGIVTKNSPTREFVLAHGASDATKVRFSPTTSSSNWCETDTNRVTNGVWSHIVVLYDGSQTTNAAACKIYIDGTDRTSTYNGTMYSATITMAASPIAIGGNVAGGTYPPALIDDVAIWRKRTLTAADVTTLYNGGHPGNVIPLEPTYYWKMGDDPLDNFDSTSGSKLLVDQTGGVNCTPTNTEAGDASSTVP